MTRIHRTNRRGVALLLVLICVLLASILTGGYLASRDNSAAIGENIASAAAARWAAVAGLDVGSAILQTDFDWRTSHSGGRLLTGYPLGNATIDLDLMDVQTDQPPIDTTEHVKLTVTATVDGVQQVATALAYSPVAPPDSVDVDLSEFAIFATNSITVQDSATVTRWPMAPLSKLGPRVALGTDATAASSVQVSGSGAAIDATTFHVSTASGSLVSVSNGPSVEKTALLDAMPIPAAPASGDAAPTALDLLTHLPLLNDLLNAVLNASQRKLSITHDNGAQVTASGNIALVSDGNYTIKNNAKLIINGNVRLVAFGDLILQTGGAIEVRPTANLTIYVKGKILLDDGYIGDPRTNSTRDNTGKAAYTDLDRIHIFSISDGNPATVQGWAFRLNSVVKATIYAPDASLNIINDSALYGRVAASSARLANNGALFYDPALDANRGFRNSDTMLFASDGHIQNAFKALTSLDAATLQTLADATGAKILPVKGRASMLVPSSGGGGSPPVVGPTDPTPRTTRIRYALKTVGIVQSLLESAP